MSSKIPSEIGRYIVEARIGHGAMGEVYRALDYRIYRSIAIKTLRLDKLKGEQDRATALKLMIKEARITGKLNHAHITTIHDVGIYDNTPFLVMEFIKGHNLKKIITENIDYPITEKIAILAVIARALHYAHQRGVLHRDIKPANIMLLKNGSPKIMDFGISDMVDKSIGNTRHTAIDKDVVISGTPQYMSPEHIKGNTYDHRSDIFSLGILAYEWLSSQKPFQGDSIKELVLEILKGNPTPLSDVMSIAPGLSKIIQKSLSVKQKDRYQSAEKFADALELFLDSIETAQEPMLAGSFTFDKFKIIDKLRSTYLFFSDFSKDELLTIFKLSHKKKYIPGEYIIREGTLGTKMYIILTGLVSIQNDTSGTEIELEKLGPGSCVGEMSLVDKMERSASVVATEPTIAIAINETVLRLSNPELCLKLYRNLATLLSEKLRANDAKYRKLLAETVKNGNNRTGE